MSLQDFERYVRFFQKILSGFSVKTNSDMIWEGLLDMERKASDRILHCA